MNETTITRQIMQNWQRQCRHGELWYHKIADPTLGGDQTNTRAVDVIASYRGVFIGMEWKLQKNTRLFPIKNIRLNQLETLRDIETSGGFGYLMIAIYLNRNEKWVYAIPIEWWDVAIDEIIKSGCKSVPLEEVFPDCRVTQKWVNGKLCWDMSKIEEMITTWLNDRKCC